MPSSGGKKCARSEEHTSELQSHSHLVCRLLLEKTKVRPPGRPGKHGRAAAAGAGGWAGSRRTDWLGLCAVSWRGGIDQVSCLLVVLFLRSGRLPENDLLSATAVFRL